MDMTKNNERILWSIFWAFVLIFISLVVAGFSAQLYVFASILSAFIDGLDPFLELCLTGLNFPRLCARNLRSGSSLNEAVDEMDSMAYEAPTGQGPVSAVPVTTRIAEVESSEEAIRVMPAVPPKLYVPEA